MRILETFNAESQEPLIQYYTSLALKSTLRVLHTDHPFDESTRIALISQQRQNLSERKLFVVDRLTEFLRVVDPAITSSTHSSNPVGTGGISDKLSERIRSILPYTNESNEHFLSRTLTFKWIDDTNRTALATHWDRRGIRIMSALENEATGVFACIEVLTRLPALLSMDHGRVDGRGVSKIVQQLLRDWNKIGNRSSVQK